MYLKSIFVILSFFSFSAQAWIIEKGDPSYWLMAQKPVPSVYTEMNQYFTDFFPATNAEAYIHHFITSMHSSLVNEAESALSKKLKEPSCKSDIKVSYPEILTKGHESKGARSFELEVLKIQSYDCLGKIDLHKVFNTLMSDQFQKDSIDGLELIETNKKPNQVCQKVSIFPFGTSHFCFTQHILATPNQYIIHSFNEENVDEPSAPAYYRETVTVFTKLSNDEVSVYNLAYARGPDMPGHFIVKKVLTSRQQKSIQNLIESAK